MEEGKRKKGTATEWTRGKKEKYIRKGDGESVAADEILRIR